MSNPIVAQIRQAEFARIMVDPAYVLIDNRPLTDNGYGKMVPNLVFDETWVEKGPVRIVARSNPILNQTDLRASFSQSSGLSETYGVGNEFVIFAAYDCDWLRSDMIIKHNNRVYRTFEPFNSTMFGEVISKFATLKDVGSVS